VNLYGAFGVGAAIELLSILLTWWTAGATGALALPGLRLDRRRRPARDPAKLAVWFALAAPMNAALSGWDGRNPARGLDPLS
jgi:hypothetical protein